MPPAPCDGGAAAGAPRSLFAPQATVTAATQMMVRLRRMERPTLQHSVPEESVQAGQGFRLTLGEKRLYSHPRPTRVLSVHDWKGALCVSLFAHCPCSPFSCSRLPSLTRRRPSLASSKTRQALCCLASPSRLRVQCSLKRFELRAPTARGSTGSSTCCLALTR